MKTNNKELSLTKILSESSQPIIPKNFDKIYYSIFDFIKLLKDNDINDYKAVVEKLYKIIKLWIEIGRDLKL